jgi:hypothetical protein
MGPVLRYRGVGASAESALSAARWGNEVNGSNTVV